MTTLTTYRPNLLGRGVFDDIFDSMLDFPQLMQRTTQGYPLADIQKNEDAATSLEFALAGFSKEELNIEVKPEERTITVSAQTDNAVQTQRRIARRSFKKTYVNYDNNLDLTSVSADYKDGLLTISLPTRPESQSINVDIS